VTSVLRGARHVRRAWPGRTEVVRWLQYGLPRYLVAALFASVSKLTFPYIFLSLLWSASQAMQAQSSSASLLRTAVDPTRSRFDLTGVLTGAPDLPAAATVVAPTQQMQRQIRP